jgi:hypothetical protein
VIDSGANSRYTCMRIPYRFGTFILMTGVVALTGCGGLNLANLGGNGDGGTNGGGGADGSGHATDGSTSSDAATEDGSSSGDGALPAEGLALFGGCVKNAPVAQPGGPTSGPTSCAKVSNDTWVFDGKNWIDANPASPPLPRGGAGTAAFFTTGYNLFLFGGYGEGGAILADFWSFKGEWNEFPATPSPPARHGAAMASVGPDSDSVVLFGGCSDAECNQPLNDTWVWTGLWTEIKSGSTPPARAYAGFTAIAKGAFLYGGRTTNGLLDDTWVFDGTKWTQQSPSTPPPPRTGASMGTTTQPVIFGGQDGPLAVADALADDTWILLGNAWTTVAGAHPSARTAAAFGNPESGATLVLFGGFGEGDVLLSDTWIYSGSWTQASPVVAPPARKDASLAFYSPNLP